MGRRKALQLILALFGSTALVSFLYPLMRFLAPPSAGAKEQKLTVKKDEIPVGGAKDIVFDNSPAIIINRPEKGFIALSKVCTHLGCIVNFEKGQGRLLCPCHGGLFDLDGNVISGPPPKPLTVYPVHVEGDNIVVG
jgi:cytochrome b6-f complex iron-sulfur subunit